jgi:hypothetical protein
MQDVTNLAELHPEIDRKEIIVLVNPNPGPDFEFSNFKFPALVKCVMSKRMGTYILQFAEKQFKDRQFQIAVERKQWLECMASTDPRRRDNAQRFCDPSCVDGGRFVPRSKEFKRPLLVDYNTEEGKKAIAEGLAELRELDASKDLAIDSGVPAAAVVSSVEALPSIASVSIEVPTDSWEKEALSKYIESMTGKRPSPNHLGNKARLLELATDAFDKNKKRLVESGVEVSEVRR